MSGLDSHRFTCRRCGETHQGLPDIAFDAPYYYPDTLKLVVRAHLRDVRTRPRIELQPTDHPLAVEQRGGDSDGEARADPRAAPASDGMRTWRNAIHP